MKPAELEDDKMGFYLCVLQRMVSGSGWGLGPWLKMEEMLKLIPNDSIVMRTEGKLVDWVKGVEKKNEKGKDVRKEFAPYSFPRLINLETHC